ncbi:alanine racemase [Leucobacter massiliensis]|uniref:Alanine racemase n=1 Tax=Leucobacter massiliensis TaxID=1686285 RepID=A0A2S9QM50_9MICO|nr:alanine racemase [Leucobacter massiliensis]PRI10648.1 alanine racemase [Leucobacter massiliensis]
MTLDVSAPALAAAAAAAPWERAEEWWGRCSEATRELPAPVVVLSLAALRRNADDLARRAGGIPVRLASKSLRVRGVIEAVLALPGFAGVLAYTLAEALWLADTIEDVVVGYPTADRHAIARLAADERAAARVTLMVDGVEQLDLVDAVAPPASRAPIRVCLELDASWRSAALGHIGVRRSPVHEPAELRALAAAVVSRPGFVLVGVMAYEAQIAGVGDRPSGRPAQGALLRAVQRLSGAELAERRAAAVSAVRELADLEFVNGGGTGSLERTACEAVVTELAAGSGLFGPHLFDHYAGFAVAPAVAFALDVVRKPTPDRATLLGGGWIASGPAAADRLPLPVWPPGLAFEPREGAGEVQTPVRGTAARALRPGDRVWMRHAKAGEVMEHTNEVVPLDADGAALPAIPSYRGEGRCFL